MYSVRSAALLLGYFSLVTMGRTRCARVELAVVGVVVVVAAFPDAHRCQHEHAKTTKGFGHPALCCGRMVQIISDRCESV